MHVVGAVFGTVSLFLAETVGATAMSFFWKAATVALLSTASSKLFGPKIPDTGITGPQVMVASSQEYRKLVYGQAMVSGPVTFAGVNGSNNEYLWRQIALCHGASEDLVSVYFDGDEIPKADIDWTAGTGASDGTGTGDVSTAQWVGDNSTKGARIFYYLGDDSQPVCGSLDSAFSAIDTNNRLRGVTHIVTRLLYNADTETVWERKEPRNIMALIKGRKLYDPRLDTTQIINATTSPVTYGSSTHRTTDSSTWAWSDNPALCVADYLLNIMGVAATSIDWPSIANAADDCEVLVVVPPAASPENTEKRFTCNGALSLGSSHKDNLDALLSSCDGRLSYSGGVWKLRASVWESSSVTLTADDLAGPVDVVGSSPKGSRFNTIRGFFIDPNRNYETVEFQHVLDSDYVTRDAGKTINYDLDLPMTNSETMAQRIAFRILEQADNQVLANLTLNAAGANIAIGDIVSVTLSELSWSSKTFRVIEWARLPDGRYKVGLREDASTRYTDPAVGDYSAANTDGLTQPAAVVPPPSSLAATGASGGIQLTWTNPAGSEYDFIDIYESASNAWGSASKIASVRASAFWVPHSDQATYYYWVRAVRLPSTESLREPNSDTSTVSAADTGGAGDGADAFALNYTNSTHAVQVDNGGTPTWTGSGGKFYCFQGGTLLTLASDSQNTPPTSPETYPGSNSQFLLDINKISGNTLTEPTITGNGTTEATLGDWGGASLTGPTVYRITAYIKGSDGSTLKLYDDVTLTPADQGADGAAGAAGDPGADGTDGFAINYTNNSHAVPVTNTGTETWTGSGGKLYAFEGGTLLTLKTNTPTGSYSGLTNSTYNLNITKVSGDTLTEPAITGSGTTTATIADWAGNLTTVTVYLIDVYIQDSNGNQLQMQEYVTLTPGDQGADGDDGIPGMPGASKICLFDDCDTGLSSTSAGKYGFNINTTTGTFTWATIVDGSSITYLTCPNLSTGSSEDYSAYFSTIQSGDMVTWYDADAYPGRWVAWRITGVGTAISGGYRFPVSFYSYYDNGSTNAIPSAAANDVEMRFSRSDEGVSIGDISPAIGTESAAGSCTVGFRVDSDGDYYIEDTGSYVSDGTWIGNGTASQYECLLECTSGSNPSGPSLDTWFACSSDRTWTVTRSSAGFTQSQCKCYYRRTSDNQVLAVQPVVFNVTVT